MMWKPVLVAMAVLIVGCSAAVSEKASFEGLTQPGCARDIPSAIAACEDQCDIHFDDDLILPDNQVARKRGWVGMTPRAACRKNCTVHANWVSTHRWPAMERIRAKWLRSYCVNIDKPNSLYRTCVRLQTQVCKLDSDNAMCASAGKRSQSYCRVFYNGNLLCPGTCYARGGDGFKNPLHICPEEKVCGRSSAQCEIPRSYQDIVFEELNDVSDGYEAD